MANSIAFAKNYVSVIDEVYQRAGVSGVLNSGRRMVRAGHNAKEILIPKISVTGLGNYTRNVGYKTGSITYEFETKTFNYDRGIRLFADVMDVEEAGVNDCFVEAGAELMRTQVAPEADAFTFAQIAGHTGVTTVSESYASADAEDILEDLRTVTSAMDENQVTTGSRILFITPTLKGVLDDFSYANPNRSNRVLERFSRIVEVPQVRFYTAIDLLSGDDDQFGYQKRVAVYTLTEDTEVDSSKTYYTRSGSGTSASPLRVRRGREPAEGEPGHLLRDDHHSRPGHQLHGGGEVGRNQVRQARGVARVLPGRARGAGQLHDEVPQVRHHGALRQQARRRVRVCEHVLRTHLRLRQQVDRGMVHFPAPEHDAAGGDARHADPEDPGGAHPVIQFDMGWQYQHDGYCGRLEEAG